MRGQVPVGQAVVRIQVQDFRQLIESKIVLPGVKIVPSQMQIHDRTERIEFERPVTLSQSFAVAAAREQEMCVPMMTVRVARIQFERSLEFRLGAGPIPSIIQFHVGQGVVSLGERSIQRDRFQGRAFRLWLHINGALRPDIEGKTQRRITVRQAAVRGGVTGPRSSACCRQSIARRNDSSVRSPKSSVP